MDVYSLAQSQASRIINVDAPRLLMGGVFLTRVLVERLVDDLEDGTETLDFSYRGVDYEIDISARDARALDKLLEPYLRVSRPRARRPAAPRSVPKTPRKASTAKEVRAWAQKEGIEVADRGRLSADIVKQYQAAHGR